MGGYLVIFREETRQISGIVIQSTRGLVCEPRMENVRVPMMAMISRGAKTFVLTREEKLVG